MSLAARCVHGAGLCVLPGEANDFRPLALRHGPLALVSTLLLVAKVAAIGIFTLTPAAAELSTITNARIVQLTNAQRVKAGLQPLAVNAKLSAAAVQKGQHMLQEDYFAHISPSGVTPWFWMSKVNYTYTMAGENLAIDFTEAEDVVAAWMASPSHRDNMLQPSYIETGVAVVTGEFQGGTSTIVVHMFGLPTGKAAAAADTQDEPEPTPAPATPTPVPATPTPTAVPAPTAAPADTAPPRVPRIATGASTVGEQVAVDVEGDAASRIHFLVNNQERDTFVLNNTGHGTHTLSLAGVADGSLTIRAFASDSANNQSALSSPLALAKDTTGPRFARETLLLLLSPATDTPEALVSITAPGDEDASLEITASSNVAKASATTHLFTPLTRILAVRMYDAAGNASAPEEITIEPQFARAPDESYLAPPARFSSLTRRLTLSAAAAIAVLLLAAIIVRIRIQRPAVIAHASLVILLAAALLLY